MIYPVRALCRGLRMTFSNTRAEYEQFGSLISSVADAVRALVISCKLIAR
jgi:hypothetical protein